MNLEEAFEKADKNDGVKGLRGYFLGSVFTTLGEDREAKEWTLLYYNPQRKNVVDCFVNKNIVTVGEATPAIKEMEELNTNVVNIDIDDALEIVSKNSSLKPINILVSLHSKPVKNKSYTVWTIGFVTADISVTSFDIDATNGRLLKEERTSLVKRM